LEILVLYIASTQFQLDLIRVHCVIEKSGHGEKDRNFVQVTVSNGRTSATFSIPDSISNGSLLYEGSRTVQPLEVSDFEDDQDQIITATVSSRVLFTVSGSIRFVSYDRSQYNVMWAYLEICYLFLYNSNSIFGEGRGSTEVSII
ncbi:hypothetical protein ANCCAN_13640, partial [Ancylostoma caninum]